MKRSPLKRKTPQCSEVHPSGERCTRELGHEGNHQLPSRHRCHAKGCLVPVARHMLMCRRHWYMVPKLIRDRVWATYREGQCDDMRPSEAWHEAADAAIAAVAAKEAAP